LDQNKHIHFYTPSPKTKAQIDEVIEIDEIVVGIDLDTGKIVTIPEETFNPKIFICGKTRQGKTMLHYSLMDNVYHKWQKKCIDLIDISHEAEEHCLEWSQDKFINEHKIIGQETRALPLVILTPSTTTTKHIPLDDEVGYKITLSFEDIIYDYENIFRGNKYIEFEKR